MNRVREFRQKMNLSQNALAKEIGVARQTINLIENNKYNPSLDLCIKLAKVLHTCDNLQDTKKVPAAGKQIESFEGCVAADKLTDLPKADKQRSFSFQTRRRHPLDAGR